MKKIVLSAVCVLTLVVTGTMAFGAASPPGQPSTGYGSPQNYICSTLYNGGPIDHNNCIDMGDSAAGTRCWVYIPSVLKNGSTAPVVVYLHGFMVIVPPVYYGQIAHLVRQGYIVIFPEYNLGGFDGMFEDTDQYAQLARAVEAVDAALALPDVVQRAELDNIYLASHSNGGMMSLGWIAGGGVPVKAMIMQHPSITMDAIPQFVKDLFLGDMIMLDYAGMAPQITCPVIIIGGVDDTIAKPEHVSAAYRSLTNASTKVHYIYPSDTYGDPDLESDHVAPCQDDGALPGWLLDLMSGMMGMSAFEFNSDDYRVHFAAVDAALAGQNRLTFNRGTWSDGKAVKPVYKIADSTVTAVTVYQHANYDGYMVQLPKGSYTLSALNDRGIKNDDLSSVKVPAGFKATLYRDNNYGGTSKILTTDEDNLAHISFNDVVSSIKIE